MKAIEQKWYISGLTRGEELQTNIATETGKPAVKVLYIEDTPSGIDVEMYFIGGHYRRSIQWNLIYNGTVKVSSIRGQVKARQIQKKDEWCCEEYR